MGNKTASPSNKNQFEPKEKNHSKEWLVGSKQKGAGSRQKVVSGQQCVVRKL